MPKQRAVFNPQTLRRRHKITPALRHLFYLLFRENVQIEPDGERATNE